MQWPYLVVDRTPHRCPYLPDQTAILPMRLPLAELTGTQFDACLARGDRRQGILLYRPDCGSCTACEAIRLDVKAFAPTKTQARMHKRGRARLRVEVGRPRVDAARVRLYNLHKRLRQLEGGEGLATAADYSGFLAESCVDTWELSYWMGEQLVGVAIVDRGQTSLSAVYCCYDPEVPGISVGVFSVMETVALCRQWGLQWLYLGFYVAGCRAMRYKASYGPHLRLIAGQWQPMPRQPTLAQV